MCVWVFTVIEAEVGLWSVTCKIFHSLTFCVGKTDSLLDNHPTPALVTEYVKWPFQTCTVYIVWHPRKVILALYTIDTNSLAEASQRSL